MNNERQRRMRLFRQLVSKRETYFIVAGALAITAYLILPTQRASAPPATAAVQGDEAEDAAVAQVYVNFIVNNGLTIDNVQAQTGLSEQQIQQSIRACMRYNGSLINGAGPVARGIDCRDVRRDVALFPNGKPRTAPPPTIYSAPPARQVDRDRPGPSSGAETVKAPQERAVDAIKRFEASRDLTDDQLAELTGASEDALERRVTACFTQDRGCDGLREIQSAIDAWEVGRSQFEAARRDQREAEGAATSGTR